MAGTLSILTDDGFPDRLRASHPAVYLVADWLPSMGFRNVRVKCDGPIRPHVSMWREYVDHGDILVEVDYGQGPVDEIVEVKHYSHNWTGALDWEYRPEFIVSRKDVYDRVDQEPIWFVYVCHDMTHAAMLHVQSTRKLWYERQKFDRPYQRLRWYYWVPLEHVIWRRIILNGWNSVHQGWVQKTGG